MTIFNEDWYSDGQCKDLVMLLQSVKDILGSIIEIGCWEGKSTISLTNTAYPQEVVCCDTWLGNITESEAQGWEHVTVQILKSRDVFSTFLNNMNESTKGNFKVVKEDCDSWLKTYNEPIKFCHLDASHDYISVKRTLELLIPKVVSGGILCGDDFVNASMNSQGLNGGVEGAVRELLPGFRNIGNLWWWVKP